MFPLFCPAPHLLCQSLSGSLCCPSHAPSSHWLSSLPSSLMSPPLSPGLLLLNPWCSGPSKSCCATYNLASLSAAVGWQLLGSPAAWLCATHCLTPASILVVGQQSLAALAAVQPVSTSCVPLCRCSRGQVCPSLLTGAHQRQGSCFRASSRLLHGDNEGELPEAPGDKAPPLWGLMRSWQLASHKYAPRHPHYASPPHLPLFLLHALVVSFAGSFLHGGSYPLPRAIPLNILITKF